MYAIYTYTYHVWDFTVQTNKLNIWEGPIKTAPLSCQHFLAPFTVPLAAPLQAVNVSEGLGRATNLFLEVQGSIQLLFCRCQATSSHFKPLEKSIFSHFVKIAVLRFQVVQPAKHCKSPRPIGWRECYCCSLRYIEHWVPVMQVWSSHVPSGVRFAKASGKKM